MRKQRRNNKIPTPPWSPKYRKATLRTFLDKVFKKRRPPKNKDRC